MKLKLNIIFLKNDLLYLPLCVNLITTSKFYLKHFSIWHIFNKIQIKIVISLYTIIS